MSAETEVPLPKLPAGAGAVDANAPKTFTTTKSGLKYRVLREGKGAKPKATNAVEVHYHGWLDNGKVFDSSYDRKESISFGLNQVIPGWTEGMQLVGEGGMIELEIPSELGYGARGAGGVIPQRQTPLPRRNSQSQITPCGPLTGFGAANEGSTFIYVRVFRCQRVYRTFNGDDLRRMAGVKRPRLPPDCLILVVQSHFDEEL